MPTNRNRSGLLTESSSLFPDNITQEISPADLRSWIADGTTSFVTQKDKSTLENAIYEASSSALASAATTDLSLASGNYVHITGTTTITSFGTCPPGARFVLVFDGVLTLTYNATSLIIPGSANKTTAAGDACMIISEGSGNWKIVGYFSISGSGGGSGTVTSVATAGLISGGTITTSGTISTSMATDKLVGRYSAGTGIMQEITVGSGLTLTAGGTLNNTATPSPTGFYAMYQSLVTQTAASSNTGYAMLFGTMDLSNQVTVVNDGSGNPTRITFANAGIYNLQFSSQFENTSNAPHDITIWLRLNGSDVAGSSGFVQIPARKAAGAGNEGHIITGWNYLLDVSAGQYYEIVWSTSDHTAVSMKFYAAGSPPPSTASVIFTVTQQAGIMAGTGITSINSLTGAAQTIATGTSGTDFAVVSSGTSHSFNLPDASASARGVITTGSQTLAGIKTFGNGTSGGEIRLLEPSGSGSNYVAIKAQAMAADYSLSLPAAAGTAGDFLQYGAGGNLAWANPNPFGAYRSVKVVGLGTGVNSTTITLSNVIFIPAGTFFAGDMMTIYARFFKSTASITRVFNNYIYINTVNSLAGSPILLATAQAGAGQVNGELIREISVLSTGVSGQSVIKNVTTPNTDWNNYILSAAALATPTINWSVDQYLIHAIAQGSALVTEIGYSYGLSINAR